MNLKLNKHKSKLQKVFRIKLIHEQMTLDK
jgi:hypothetical protein